LVGDSVASGWVLLERGRAKVGVGVGLLLARACSGGFPHLGANSVNCVILAGTPQGGRGLEIARRVEQ